MALTVQLPSQSEQTQFNLRRWTELLADPEVCKVEGRIETDRFGHVVMSPPPAPSHGSFQSRVSALLDRFMTTGRVFTECPISTADGVKAADVAWASPGRLRELSDQPCFPRAPEICVEVISPSNSESEIRAKMDLYFDAGAQEVWLCRQAGEMEFFVGQGVRANSASTLCPAFPSRVHLRSDED